MRIIFFKLTLILLCTFGAPKPVFAAGKMPGICRLFLDTVTNLRRPAHSDYRKKGGQLEVLSQGSWVPLSQKITNPVLLNYLNANPHAAYFWNLLSALQDNWDWRIPLQIKTSLAAEGVVDLEGLAHTSFTGLHVDAGGRVPLLFLKFAHTGESEAFFEGIRAAVNATQNELNEKFEVNFFPIALHTSVNGVLVHLKTITISAGYPAETMMYFLSKLVRADH